MNKFLVFSIISAIFLINLSSSFPVDEKLGIEKVESEPIFVENVTENEEIKEDKELKKNDARPKKTQRNFPQTYYVTSKVNGRFGKSVRAFTSDEFYEQYPLSY